MSRTKAQKKEILEKLKAIMKAAESLVFVNVHGLKVKDATEMRRSLKKEGVGFFVAKKTLTSIALTDNKYAGEAPVLSGEFGLAYGNDPVTPARGIFEFQKKFKDKVAILGGVFEKKFKSQVEMMEIASIPPMKTLQGMFLNVINSPIQGFVMALGEIAKKKA
ncbi:MAG: 50S ribosomal protein L10 [Candidatus Paceibacterota bacterium]